MPRLPFHATCISALASILALANCGPLPEGPVIAYEVPAPPAGELSVLQVSGCTAGMRVNGIGHWRNCNPGFILAAGDQVIEVRQLKARDPSFRCAPDEAQMSWKNGFCDAFESSHRILKVRTEPGHVYYLGVCRWRRLWLEDLSEGGRVIAGQKPDPEPDACPDLRDEALALPGARAYTPP